MRQIKMYIIFFMTLNFYLIFQAIENISLIGSYNSTKCVAFQSKVECRAVSLRKQSFLSNIKNISA